MTGNELKELRMSREWSKNKTAEMCEVPATTYKRWEQKGVPDNRLYLIYRGFGIKPTPDVQNEGYIDDVPRDQFGMPLRCKGCYYRHGYNRAGVCNYGLQTGVPRYCSVAECDKYKKGVYKSQNELY